MINTKLILVDGIPGSGKSTTTHFIARQLEKNGIKVKWFHEQENNHPLYFYDKVEITNSQEDLKATLDFFPAQITQFTEQVFNDDAVYIIESYLFLRIVERFITNNSKINDIKNFYAEYFSVISKLNPVVVHLYQENTETALKLTCNRRGGEAMKNWYISAINSDCNLFCKSRNLSGEQAVVAFFAEETKISRELFSTFDCKKIQIENSAQDWPTYRKKIMDFLEVPLVSEILFDKSYEKFCGNYSWIIIHIKDNRLCVDAWWPNLKLLPIGENEFQIEGFQIAFKFIPADNGEILSLKFTKALSFHYKEGDVRIKINPVELSQIKLETFCGNYWCESEKLDRKIYINEGRLYYWRSENNETELLPISKNELVMTRTSAVLTFDLAQNGKTFILHSEGENDISFVTYEASEK